MVLFGTEWGGVGADTPREGHEHGDSGGHSGQGGHHWGIGDDQGREETGHHGMQEGGRGSW